MARLPACLLPRFDQKVIDQLIGDKPSKLAEVIIHGVDEAANGAGIRLSRNILHSFFFPFRTRVTVSRAQLTLLQSSKLVRVTILEEFDE